MVVSNDTVSAWFVREILPLEAKLVRYLRHHWRNADDIPDLRQEVYARVFEAARERIPDNPRNFLLVCARNLLIDQTRRGQIVPMETFADIETLGLASEAPEPDSMVMKRDEIRRLQAALEHLPPRTREAVVLACEGLTPTEIAKRMGVAQQTASRFLAKGTLALANILYGRTPGSGRS
jgi:RNA polymerase sigma factor (sigma-70 family)